MGVVTDPITNIKNDIVAPQDGRVIGMALNQVVLPGFAAFHLGINAPEETIEAPDIGPQKGDQEHLDVSQIDDNDVDVSLPGDASLDIEESEESDATEVTAAAVMPIVSDSSIMAADGTGDDVDTDADSEEPVPSDADEYD